MSLITLTDLSYQKSSNVILDNISLTISKGQFLTIIGPSGAGKTTLIKIIIGLNRPTKGQINYNTKINIGYIPQKININRLMPLTVRSFLDLCVPAQNQVYLYKEFGITNLLTESLHHLSGGELQRVLLAQALGKFSFHNLAHVNDHREPSIPEVLILDEPSKGLDSTSQLNLYKLLTTYNRNHQMTIVMVSHDLNFVHRASSHVICLNKHICCQGMPTEISHMTEYQQMFPDYLSYFSSYFHDHHHHHDRIHPLIHQCPKQS